MYYRPIFGYILKRTGNVHVAQDIVSETFFKALDRLWQFRWRNISISSWLYRIANNETNSYFRKQKKNVYSVEDMLEKSGIELEDDHNLVQELINQEKELERNHEWAKARKIIASLPEKYQEVLCLRFFDDKKIKEIADILGKREGTVKSLLSRGISMIRNKMRRQKQCAQPNQDMRVVGAEAISPASKKN